jgi:peptidoglycan/xylan/chitin deacetylase (PgdA/CDA1 family)
LHKQNYKVLIKFIILVTLVLSLNACASNEKAASACRQPNNAIVEAMGTRRSAGRHPVTAGEEIFETFQVGHGWVKAYDGPGTVSNDMDMHLIGSSSLAITTDGASTHVHVSKTGVSPAFDLREKAIKLVMRVDDADMLDELKLYLSDDNLASYYAYDFTRLFTRGSSSDVWMTITVNLEDTALRVGNVDLSSINSFQFYVKDRGNGSTTVWINKLSFIDRPMQGAVIVTFDDNFRTVYTNGLPIMAKYRIPATSYTITEKFESDDRLTIAQMKELQDVYGWDIACHTHTHAHLRTLTEAEITSEFAACKTNLIVNGFSKGADHIAFPFGEYEETTSLKIAKKYFVSARTINEHSETDPPADRYRLRIYNLTEADAIDAVKARIWRACEQKEILILLFHDIQDDPVDSADISISKFKAVMDLIHESGIRTMTISDYIKPDLGK